MYRFFFDEACAYKIKIQKMISMRKMKEDMNSENNNKNKNKKKNKKGGVDLLKGLAGGNLR